RPRIEVDPVTSGEPRGTPVGNDKIIVLPFQYLASGEDDYIADGMTELLTSRLAVLKGVYVISRTTSMHFKDAKVTVADVADLTGAHWVVEGSILQSGNRIQVVVQLIDARTDAHIWADDYIRDIGDSLQLQNEIVKKVAGAIRVRLGAEAEDFETAPSLAPDIMRRYMRGRHELSRRTVDALRLAVDCFTEVCDAAPDFAGAWASRAEARYMLCHYGILQVQDAAPACRSDIEHALSLDPDQGIGLTCRAALRFMLERDYAGAERDLQRVLELLPGYSIALLVMANVCAAQEKLEDAEAWMNHALVVNPLDVGINMNVGDHNILQGRYEDAVAALDKALELMPDHRPSALRKCWAIALAGRHEDATSELAALGPLDERDWPWFEYAALVAGAGGRGEAADRYYGSMQELDAHDFVPPWSLARAAAAAGHANDAVRWLEKTVAAGSTSLPFINVTPAFEKLRSRPDFKKLLA
ncbi:MAG: hypothetical protein KJO76_08170, partial [Gammaproteobacteria bacterium]|nr:hypothetical protein [Gammaproteobacteria bacterium]